MAMILIQSIWLFLMKMIKRATKNKKQTKIQMHKNNKMHQ